MPEYIERYIQKNVADDLKHKMVFIGGPRQSGKTTFARAMLADAGADAKTRYLNWDVPKDRQQIMAERFPAGPGLLALDEIHKYSRWRQIVKGLFDGRRDELNILVTGSARLDYYRRGGDSLQGRYHFYRLFPFSLAELKARTRSDVTDLFTYGGFPEQFLHASEKETRRWSREYASRIVHEDLRDLERVLDVGLVERLAARLPELVGSPLSLNGLREDLQVSHQSITRWVAMLENLYMIFRIYPFGAPNVRAVKKEAKHYHFDWIAVHDEGARFENLVACHLNKWCCFLQDTEGRATELRYFRDIDKREVDFVIVEDGKPVRFIECKKGGTEVSPSLRYLKERFPGTPAMQVTLDGTTDLMTKEKIRLCPANVFLRELV